MSVLSINKDEVILDSSFAEKINAKVSETIKFDDTTYKIVGIYKEGNIIDVLGGREDIDNKKQELIQLAQKISKSRKICAKELSLKDGIDKLKSKEITISESGIIKFLIVYKLNKDEDL